jgi:hypothetical protein
MTFPPFLDKAPRQPSHINGNVLHDGGIAGSSQPVEVAQLLAASAIQHVQHTFDS